MAVVADVLSVKGDSIFSVPADLSVLECTQRMNDKRIGCVLVVDSQHNLLGVFTERDVLRRVVAAERAPQQCLVGEVMTPNPITCAPDTDLDEVAQTMRDQRIRHLPVVDLNGRLRGMVSIGDLNAHRVSEQDVQIQMLNDYVYGRA